MFYSIVMSDLPVLTSLQVQPSKQLVESFRCHFLQRYNSSLYVCNEVICASLYDVNPTRWNWTNKINQINMCTPAKDYVTFTFSAKHFIFSCLCIWKWNLRIHISPLPLQASSLAIPHLQTWVWASFTFRKDLRSEPHAAPCVQLINSPPQRPPSAAALGGWASGGG